jgi:hypothetical protein
MQNSLERNMKMAVFWDVAARSLFIALMMEAVNTSETSVSFYQRIRRNIPEDSHLHTRLRENLESHEKKRYFTFGKHCQLTEWAYEFVRF